MNQKQAMDYVNKLLFGLQRARSASRESLESMGGRQLSDEIINNVLEDLTPWLHGPKGNGLLNALSQVCDRGRVSGMEFYNFMTIIHHLDPTVGAMAGALSDTTFPQPSVHWCIGFEE